MESVGHMEEQAKKRKERLLSMRKKHKLDADDNECEPPEKRNAEALPKPVFRSYKPADDSLKESQIKQEIPAEISEHVKEQLESTELEPLADDIDLTTLAPRKPDWDLKRDIAKKLEKLERRTQRAIAELIRERLTQGKDNLANIVNAHTDIAAEDDED